MYRSHGENGDVDEDAIREEVPLLHTLLPAFHENDIFNADEFGLFYRQAPNTSIGPRWLLGKKVKKDRITFLAYTTAPPRIRVVFVVKLQVSLVWTTQQPKKRG